MFEQVALLANFKLLHPFRLLCCVFLDRQNLTSACSGGKPEWWRFTGSPNSLSFCLRAWIFWSWSASSISRSSCSFLDSCTSVCSFAFSVCRMATVLVDDASCCSISARLCDDFLASSWIHKGEVDSIIQNFKLWMYEILEDPSAEIRTPCEAFSNPPSVDPPQSSVPSACSPALPSWQNLLGRRYQEQTQMARRDQHESHSLTQYYDHTSNISPAGKIFTSAASLLLNISCFSVWSWRISADCDCTWLFRASSSCIRVKQHFRKASNVRVDKRRKDSRLMDVHVKLEILRMLPRFLIKPTFTKPLLLCFFLFFLHEDP